MATIRTAIIKQVYRTTGPKPGPTLAEVLTLLLLLLLRCLRHKN